MPFEFSVDLESELQRLLGTAYIVVPLSVDAELRHFAQSDTGERRGKARAALQLIEKYEKAQVEALNADDAVLMCALKRKGYVVTNDTALRKRLRAAKVPVIFLKGKAQLALDE